MSKPTTPPKTRIPRRLLHGWIRPLLPMLLVLLSVRSAVADWNDVPTGSMQPTILEGDRIFVNKLAYGLRVPFTLEWISVWGKPQRGEVVVFMAPHDGTRMVKRVIGLPGDRVELRDNRLWIDGHLLAYGSSQSDLASDRSKRQRVRESIGEVDHLIQLTPSASALRDFGPMAVPSGSYLMMGDNRDASFDSRYFGFVPGDHIVGRTSRTAMSFDPARHYWPRWDRFLRRLD